MKRISIIAAMAWAACAAHAQTACRTILADQSDYYSNLGFYLDLEASNPAGGPCQLNSLTMYVGVADGSQWRFPSFVPTGGWQYGHQYNVVVTIGPTQATIQVDGASVPVSLGGFVPVNEPVTVNELPSWAAGPAVFSVLQGNLTIANSSGAASYTSPTTNLPPAVLELSGPDTAALSFTSSGSDTQMIVTSFTLQPAPGQSAPLIDVYGQSVQSAWSGKVSSDADLQADNATEQAWLAAHPAPANVDQWGGLTNALWSQPATGFYTVAKRNGYWWLISPGGYPVFYTGLSGPPALNWDVTPVTGREWEFLNLPSYGEPAAEAWNYNVWGVGDNTYYYAFITSNLIRKYGSDWQNLSTARAAARLPSWGFTGLGKWSSPVATLPIVPVVTFNSPALSTGHIDPWDSTMTASFAAQLPQQMQNSVTGVAPGAILGWSWMNEIQGIVLASEAQAVLNLGAAVPAKQHMIDYGVQTVYGGLVASAASAWGVTASTSQDLYNATSLQPPAGDLEQMREYYENAVLSFVYQTFKSVDPNHLYLGFWIVPGWWADPSDWTIALANCDVLGYDWYSFQMLTDSMKALLAQLDKPAIIGEFSFPPTYGLVRGFGVYAAANAADDTSAGDAYQEYVRQAAREPATVGAMWFQYRDEPLAGRGPCPAGQPDTVVCGEHYAFGAADVTDRPKYDLVEKMRQTNLCAGPVRLALTDPQRKPTEKGSPCTTRGGLTGSGESVSSRDR